MFLSLANEVDDAALFTARASPLQRRRKSLSQVRELLIDNHLTSAEVARATSIKHHESGEPFLEFPEGTEVPLKISISHSGSWFACLLSEAIAPAAIDLEVLNRERNVLALAQQYFFDEEIVWVQKYGSVGFYRIWTAKEAIAKLNGQGLSCALQLRLDLNENFFSGETIAFESDGYCLEQHVSQDYVFTIVRHRLTT
jgi:4'-phosphopantetheinyl transferase